ncbi:hypothetical protein CPB84DRAFT_1746670 [Gymnopilus junonius]|uniref:ubiquitinyl hydrolase 1 n=1 Tax=Gymnopilus junonius TaxID=109634 RepID=A0A9P5TPB5_GYMJU|nr:hypothetical protein CPB84DRAFT_1746670 [Gymnopilus junonius]
MPGVALLPNTPPGNIAPQNGPPSHRDLSIPEIKQKAREGVNKEARGVSAITLIKTARTQILYAKECEARGDLRSALGSYIKAASLAKMTMDSPEYVQEGKGKGGVVRKELNDLLENDGRDITTRVNAVEEKLKAIERAQTTDSAKKTPVGGSIADRLRALQDSGLSLGQTKLRDSPADLPTPPISPRNFSSVPQYNTTPLIPSPAQVAPSTSSSTQSIHALVSPSSLGPPSPTSTPSSSPPSGTSLLSSYDINGFNQAFPSIDELDEDPAFSLPSVPTGIPSRAPYSPKDFRNGHDPSGSPLQSFKNFTVPIERPSSTPITPTNNSFQSRPASPNGVGNSSNSNNNNRTIPHKPSGLSNGISVNAAGPSTSSSTGSGSSSRPKTPIPNKNAATPKELLGYIREHNVLLIDVRNRADFDREHIKANAVVCIEPSVLMREGVTAESLENAMVIAPRQETSLFINRDKFDLVAVYDGSSTSFGSSSSHHTQQGSPLAILVRVISEQAFKKMLKRMPMMLVGGIEAWKRELGDGEVIRGVGYSDSPPGAGVPIQRPVPTPAGVVSPLLAGSASASASASASVMNPYAHASANGVAAHSTGYHGQHEVWTPPQRTRLDSTIRVRSVHTRMPADAGYNGILPTMVNGTGDSGSRPLTRRPAMLRPSSGSISFTRNHLTHPLQRPFAFAFPISYPQFPRHTISPSTSGTFPPSTSSSTTPFTSSSTSSLASASSATTTFTPPPPLPPLPSSQYDIASPPQASINPSHVSRRRSDFVDQSQEALSGYTNHTTAHAREGPIDYPELQLMGLGSPAPTICWCGRKYGKFGYDDRSQAPADRVGLSGGYWADVHIGTSGLKNLGNTCYMNAPIQCLSATVPFSRFFTGKLAGAFAKLLHDMWGGDLPYLTPIDFRRSICQLNSQYNGSDQHDSQEFLSFLIDGIHEDLNRIIGKPNYTHTPEEEAELERLPPQIASDREWRAWRSRNDSLIVDFFQGQMRNRLECLTCHKTSTTYNVFSILSLPVPNSRSGKVPIERCIDAFFNEEVLEKDDAWDCPQCKAKRRASKKLSLARLPPVLVIHLKRFEANGRFSDKIDTFVDFPMRSLDLTNYMPPPLPPGADKSQLNGGLPMSLEDPRTQLPPYRYDLYGVTNHYGNLSSGHYTAFIASRGGWMYCDDSSVKPVDPKQVVSQKAYVLFYKRVRS